MWSTMRQGASWAVAAVIVIAVGYLVGRESLLQRPATLTLTTAGSVDMCLSCHQDMVLDSAHDAKVIGCAPCHLGDPLAIEKEPAHLGMVQNPGDLRHVEKTCAVEGCHPADAHKVKNSLMATNRGILGTLLYYWGESDSQDTDLTVEQLLATGESSLALDYYRKLCATCHLWKQKNDLEAAPQFFKVKGGGCSACHFQRPGAKKKALATLQGDDQPTEKRDSKIHPFITARVEQANCIRCHNRSGRIGLSYLGVFEAEGYGTPYEGAGLSSKQLPGERFYLEIADDIHHRKGMECIDCHTRNEVMGDGTSYAHYEEQLEISCITCHSATPGTTRKGQKLNNLTLQDGQLMLRGKVGDEVRPLQKPAQGICDFPAHNRVSCEACHSTWVPQCYGCHVEQDRSKTHLDKLTLAETPGRWQEGRSYIRYERPMLGIWGDEVVIVTPGCQDIVTLVDESGRQTGGFDRFTMAAINPHTTQAKGRECADCHASPKTVGLGEGTLYEEDGQLQFRGVHQGLTTANGQTVPLDGYVTLDGTPLQHSSRPDVRPFNGTELKKILRVGRCTGCHDSYLDPIWRTYTIDTSCLRTATDSPQANNGAAATRREQSPH